MGKKGTTCFARQDRNAKFQDYENEISAYMLLPYN